MMLPRQCHRKENGTKGVALLNVNGRADRVIRRENGRGEAVGKMGQSGDWRGAVGKIGQSGDWRGAVGKIGQSGDWRGVIVTHSEEVILTDSVKRVSQIDFNNKPIQV